MTLNDSIFILPKREEMKTILEEIDTTDDYLRKTFLPKFLDLSDGIFNIDEISTKAKKIVDNFIEKENYPFDMEDALHHLAGDVIIAFAVYGLKKEVNKKLGL